MLDTQRADVDVARHRAELRATQLSEAASREFDVTLRSVDAALLRLRRVYVEGGGHFETAVQDVVSAYAPGVLQYVIVVGTDGYVSYTSGPEQARTWLGDRAHIQAHGEGKPDRVHIGAPVMGRMAGVQIVQVTRAIRDGQRFVGVIGMALRPDQLSANLAALQIEPSDMLAVVRTEGEFIARSHGLDEALKTKLPKDRPFLAAQPGARGVFRSPSTVDKVPLVFSWRRLADWPLSVVAAVDEQRELGQLDEQQLREQRHTAQALMLMVAFACGIAAFVQRIDQKNLQLARSESRHRALFERSRVPMLMVDPDDGAIVDANRAAAEFYGWNRQKLRGMRISDINVLQPQEIAAEMALARSQQRDCFYFVHRLASGETRQVEVRSGPMEIDGRTLLYSIVHDITERRQAESAVASEAARLAALLDTATDGIHILDETGRLTEYNRAFAAMLGYSEDELQGMHVSQWDAAISPGNLLKMIGDLMRQPRRFETRHRRKDGSVIDVEISSKSVQIDGRILLYNSARDITARKAAEEEVKHLAFYDTLTHLPNRRLMIDRLQHALASSARNDRGGAVLFIDLDNFKTLNDTRGHDVGDLLLQEVAARLATCLRVSDSVARFGGDEFVVLLEDLSPTPQVAAAQAAAVGEKILDSLDRPFVLAGLAHHASASIGIALFGGQQAGIDELLKRADLAMYQAKAGGRNGLRCFDPAMQAVISSRSAIEADLRQGLERAEFVLDYQPQVDCSGRLVGAEALLRWRHPQRGLMLPGEFIALAEESGLILPLGQWVLEAACAQAAAWAAQPALSGLELAVNVSATQFRQDDFVDRLLRTLEGTGADAGRLTLELTESVLVASLESTAHKMNLLRARGVRFSLDDFGTGHSSLAYVSRLPIDQLKIDRSFVMGIESNDNAKAICAATIGLAHALKLEVVGEGVETAAQRDFLGREHGCDRLQGKLFSGPLSASEFEAYALAQTEVQLAGAVELQRRRGTTSQQGTEGSAVHSD